MATTGCVIANKDLRDEVNAHKEDERATAAFREMAGVMMPTVPHRRFSDPDPRGSVLVAGKTRKRRLSQTNIEQHIERNLERLELGDRPGKVLRQQHHEGDGQAGEKMCGIVGDGWEVRARENGIGTRMRDEGGPHSAMTDAMAWMAPDQESRTIVRTFAADHSSPITLPRQYPLQLSPPSPSPSPQLPLVEPASIQSPLRIIVHKDAKSTIYLHPILAQNLRSHQVEGLQFLWKEIAVAPEPAEKVDSIMVDNKKLILPPGSGGGALLAHTMGLGKTVTIIAFLFTLAEAQGLRPFRTADPSLAYHFRRGLHQSRVLILVPGGLLQNWMLELQTWRSKFPEVNGIDTPGKTLLRSVYTMVNIKTLESRIDVLQEWHNSGGILLMGHGLFRTLVNPKTLSQRLPSQQEDINFYLLLPGPEIVIADEAHAFKTHLSKLTQSVQLIQTRSKIALTASPLSNNLFEFWSLMNWVWRDCPISLNFKRFRKDYVTPISIGFERLTFREFEVNEDVEMVNPDDDDNPNNLEGMAGLAVSKLQYIIQSTSQKMHRKNITTIKQLLKPKTEFIIRISLTAHQAELYNEFLDDSSVLKDSSIWRHFCLRAVCNHPEIFRIVSERDPDEESEILLQIRKKRKAKRKRSKWGKHYVGDWILLEKALDRLLAATDGVGHVFEMHGGSSNWLTNASNGITLPSFIGEAASNLQNSLLESAEDDRVDLNDINEEDRDADFDEGDVADERDESNQVQPSLGIEVPQCADASVLIDERPRNVDASPMELTSIVPLQQLKAADPVRKAQIVAVCRAAETIEESNKFKLLFALIAEFKAIGDRVLLFSHSIDTLGYLYILARLLGFNVLRLDGSVPFPQRQTDLVSFNGGGFDIYLVSTKAGGVGLNLQCANRVIILDNDHSPLWEQQAIGRSYRLGQIKEVFVYRFLVERTLETRIAREKYKKVRLADIVVDGNWVKRREYAREDDHKTVWRHSEYLEAPAMAGGDGWRGRDAVLDKVVESLGIVTEVILDEDETTSAA